MNIIEQLNKEEMARLGKTIPSFSPGDTVIVNVSVVEGERKRVQAYEGVVIGKRNRGLNSSFTVRKISYGVGVERIFPLHTSRIEKIEVVSQGQVRRARLNYLRGLQGKAARIIKTERAIGEDGPATGSTAAAPAAEPAPAPAAT